jgi:hypothetical protein
MLCDEMGNLGRVDSLLTAATLMRSWGHDVMDLLAKRSTTAAIWGAGEHVD